MSKSRKIGLGIVGTLLVLLIIGALYYFLVLTKPKNVFENATNQIVSKVNGLLKETSFFNANEELSLTANVKYSDSDNSVLSKYSYSAQIDLDKNNKNFLGSLNALKDNQEVIGASIQANDTKAYVNIPKIYDKSMIIGDTEELWDVLALNKLSNEDYIYLLNFMEKAFLNSLKNSDFQTSKENKERQITLTLEENRQKEIVNNIIEEIDKDSKAKSIIATMSDTEENEIINNLKQEANYLNGDKIEIIFNTKNFSHQITKIVIKENNVEQLSMTIDNDNYTIVSADLKISITKNNKNYDIKINEGNEEIGSITYKKEKATKWQAEFKIEDIHGTVSYDKVKKDNLKLGLSLTADNKFYNIEANITMQDKANIPEINPSNAVDIDDISENEAMEILTKLMENEFIKDISESLSSGYNNYADSYDYDFDFDSSDDYDLDFDYDYNDNGIEF